MWDYPRPPRVEPTSELVRVDLGGEAVAQTTSALRVLETSHPPTYYLPREAFTEGALVPAQGSSFCEWKGRAAYYDLVAGGRVAERAGWTYPEPVAAYAMLRGYVAVMPALVDACWVEGERVVPQEGGF